MTHDRPYVTFDSRMYRRPKRRRLVIVNKFRFIFATVMALLVLSILFSYISGNFMSVASTNQQYIEVTVSSGDTLWEIASEYNYFQDDIRQVIYDIKRINHLPSSSIYPGQVLRIPISKESL